MAKAPPCGPAVAGSAGGSGVGAALSSATPLAAVALWVSGADALSASRALRSVSASAAGSGSVSASVAGSGSVTASVAGAGSASARCRFGGGSGSAVGFGVRFGGGFGLGVAFGSASVVGSGSGVGGGFGLGVRFGGGFGLGVASVGRCGSVFGLGGGFGLGVRFGGGFGLGVASVAGSGSVSASAAGSGSASRRWRVRLGVRFGGGFGLGGRFGGGFRLGAASAGVGLGDRVGGGFALGLYGFLRVGDLRHPPSAGPLPCRAVLGSRGSSQLFCTRQATQAGGELARDAVDQPLDQSIASLLDQGLAERGTLAGELGGTGHLHVRLGFLPGEGHGDSHT